MRRLAVLAACGLAACGVHGTEMVAPGYTTDAEGLAVAGSPLRIDFGRAEAGVVAAVTRLEGGPPRTSGACSDDTVRTVSWHGGPTLFFREGAFLGWAGGDGRSAGLSCDA